MPLTRAVCPETRSNENERLAPPRRPWGLGLMGHFRVQSRRRGRLDLDGNQSWATGITTCSYPFYGKMKHQLSSSTSVARNAPWSCCGRSQVAAPTCSFPESLASAPAETCLPFHPGQVPQPLRSTTARGRSPLNPLSLQWPGRRSGHCSTSLETGHTDILVPTHHPTFIDQLQSPN